MYELLFFIIGLLLGGIAAFAVLCCLQINRINKYEAEIRRLRIQLSEKKNIFE